MPQAKSNVTAKKLDELINIIQQTYLADDRPWIVGYSGGKDSTCTLQIVWEALARLPKEKRTKKIYSISSDTYVEMPLIEQYLLGQISTLNHGATEQDLPIEAYTVEPDVDETFWVNMIGRGYPAPYRNFRWCTDRMKIKPTSRFIKDKIATHGEVVIVLGVRYSESSARAGSMQSERTTESGKKVGRKILSKYLSQHKDLAGALIFSPIEDWSTEDVWEYLRGYCPPWGGDHKELERLYSNAQKADDDGEDELALKTFGNSRFGCWTCTVVQRDLSMEAFIEKGEEWLKPLLKFRNDLMRTFEQEFKFKHRKYRRRTGRIETKDTNDGQKKLIWGPFTLEYRQHLLRKLLKTQLEVCELKQDPSIELIRKNELYRIRQLWCNDEGDWADSLPKIYEEILGEKLEVPRDDWSGMGKAEHEILQEVCAQNNIPKGLVTELFDLERRHHGMSRRSKIFDKIDSIFKKDWRTREEVFAEIGYEMSIEDDGVGGIHNVLEKNNSR
ncbi:DNA phosphorothioation system sulfurtransferase DndC [Halodesulfovibrio aestuarii]|uniref:DNA sulfur modification protein DndC n=1 Tax=Halodesulfovibrio aestuarii TaxID=126333 RepID=A0A8G2FA28_9BACT|nr:DNA phosphorothioation system sulfurtransferase DndC [Halodesulfovibrio aestuarii]SHI72694.1 DNA sulfur modification protein DndC [Halodesulfovibrio aestuarii]